MKNKALIVLVVLLAVVVVFESAYLISLRQHRWVRGLFMPYRHMPSIRALDRDERNLEKAEKWDPVEDMERMLMVCLTIVLPGLLSAKGWSLKRYLSQK